MRRLTKMRGGAPAVRLLLALAVALLAAGAGAADVEIVVPDDAGGVARYAAEELKHHVAKALGDVPAVLYESACASPRHGVRFHVGATRAAAEAGLSGAPLADEERIVKIQGKDVFLLGGDTPMGRNEVESIDLPAARGTLYAVYDFLENELGVKWIWPGETGEVIPKRRSLVLRDTYRRSREPLENRTYFMKLRKGSEQGRFLLRHRVGRRVNVRISHAFGKYWERFSSTHPEFFAMLPDGSRRPMQNAAGYEVTLCVSQPALWRQIVEDWIPAYERGKKGRFPLLPWICCCENDSPGMCTCDACRAWDAPDDRFARNPYWNGSGKDPLVSQGRFGRLSDVRWGESGTRPTTDAPASVSDRYASFYNHVLAEARKSYPEARVAAYAYANYIEAPLRTRVDPGVVIEFVPRSYFPYGKEESDFFRKHWLGWRKAGARDMWLRPNFPHALGSFPVDCGRVILDDFAFAYTNGMTGCALDSLMGAWSSAAMSHYAITRAFREPLRGYEKARADMVSAFGAAASEINSYFDFVESFCAGWTEESFQKVRWANKTVGGVPGGGFNRQEYILADFYPDDFFTTAYSLLKSAERAARNDREVVARVEFLRKGIRNTELTRAVRIAEKAWAADAASNEKRKAFATAYEEMQRYRAKIEGEWVFDPALASHVENKMMGWDKKAAAAGVPQSNP